MPVTTENGFAKNTSWGRTPLVLATSQDEGTTWTQNQAIETDSECGFCYTAIHETKESILLAYCCGGRGPAVLQDMRIRRIEKSEFRA
jgi:hypothetical protein